jgi:hypothetical protein
VCDLPNVSNFAKELVIVKTISAVRQRLLLYSL